MRMNHQPLAQSVKELENVKIFVIVKQESHLNVVVVGGTTLISMTGMDTMTNVNLNSLILGLYGAETGSLL